MRSIRLVTGDLMKVDQTDAKDFEHGTVRQIGLPVLGATGGTKIWNVCWFFLPGIGSPTISPDSTDLMRAPAEMMSWPIFLSAALSFCQ